MSTVKNIGIAVTVVATALGLFVDFRETSELFSDDQPQGNVMGALDDEGGTPPVAESLCGNGQVEPGEACDNGTGTTDALCASDCTLNVVQIEGGSLMRGFTDAELKAGLHLKVPSRRSAETIRKFAELSVPATPVQYEKFWLMRTEVTWTAMNEFLDDTDDRKDDVSIRLGVREMPRFPLGRTAASIKWHVDAMSEARRRFGNKRKAGDLPARVDLKSAIAFCAWLGGKLPTEDQWEAAARGKDGKRTFPWGDRVPASSPEDCDLMTGFFHSSKDPPTDFNCGGRRISEVGSHPAGCTPERVCDLTGNADEYVVPGAVVWREWRDATDRTYMVAGLPGPRKDEFGDDVFLKTCEWNATEDPYGFVSGSVSDCVSFVGEDPRPPDPQKTYPATSTRVVLRGGNFNDSIPLLYQNRGRYPYGEPNDHKGFRCVL